MKFSTELKALRKLHKMTQFTFAKQMDMSVETLRNWEQGKNEPCKIVQNWTLAGMRASKLLAKAMKPKRSDIKRLIGKDMIWPKGS